MNPTRFASLVAFGSKGGGADGPHRRAGEQRRSGRYTIGLDTDQAGMGKGTCMEKVHVWKRYTHPKYEKRRGGNGNVELYMNRERTYVAVLYPILTVISTGDTVWT